MKIPYGWVRELVDVDLTDEAAADRLINAGVDVASVTPIAPDSAASSSARSRPSARGGRGPGPPRCSAG
jgi:hypothetical protein